MRFVHVCLLALVPLVFAASSTTGCSDIKHAYDCDQICNKYKDCFDSNYDTGTCASKCRNHASDDDAYGDKADACQACIDDKSCAGSTFQCASECIGIVP
jgi:hypothetical protein